ncbi:hypothetical protein BBH88_18275 [Planococcus antarcticus DSM 14505]|uniref:Uncharacterized protein n=1 Tax=Planococcus antarcticus DSM 14505 TaxID=1185653 RepID=A0ABN4RNQ9_9BACL|nr:hypothetical protein BBH88_18275 [Planococcus antarcticus DSM 14505]
MPATGSIKYTVRISGEEEILATLKPIFFQFAKERQENEHFGDFVIRAGYVAPVTSGLNFHS